MAKIGREVSGHEELGLVGGQAEGAIVMGGVVVVGGWCLSVWVCNDPVDRVSLHRQKWVKNEYANG